MQSMHTKIVVFVLIGVLIVRPAGLLGNSNTERS